jgi:hypothetical protein
MVEVGSLADPAGLKREENLGIMSTIITITIIGVAAIITVVGAVVAAIMDIRLHGAEINPAPTICTGRR